MGKNKRHYDSPPRTGGDSTKRVRFDSEDDDPIAGAEELDFATKKPRRGQVQTGGYDSDSSNDDDERQAKPQPSNEAEEDDDMFAAGAKAGPSAGAPDPNALDNDTRVRDAGLELKGDAGRGGKEFLELGDIEGQEFSGHGELGNSRRKVHEDEEDYVEGEERANADDSYIPKERRSAEGMGFAMTGFNMSEEMAEGKFTADGSYQANGKDPDAVHDNWLQALTSKDIEAAMAAKRKQEELAADRSRQAEMASMSRIDCLKALLEGQGGLVKPGETVQKALARLGQARKAEVEAEKDRLKKEKRKQRPAKPARDFDAPDDPNVHHPSAVSQTQIVQGEGTSSAKGKGREVDATTISPLGTAIDTLTTLTSTLLSAYNETEIYEETHEGIIRQLIAEGEVPRGWKPTNASSDGSGEPSSQGGTAAGAMSGGVVKRSVISRPLISRPKS